MERLLNPRIEKQTIYEIYRACRLCGAGAGYKMPIIQNVVDLEASEVELKQKIRECVQVEVTQDDKMPPLICELCVDKVNDFYEFLELCRQTNKRTRMRLGLPMQTMSKGSSSTDSGDCILGMTEPVYLNEDSDGEPLAKHKTKSSKNAKKKESGVRVKMEVHSQYRDTRSSGVRASRYKKASVPPATRTSRSSGHSDDSHVALSRLQGHGSKISPKSILKKEKDVKIKIENDTSLVSSRLKRASDRETSKPQVPVKKVKIAIKNTMASSKQSARPSARCRDRRRPSPPPPAPTYRCAICNQPNKTPQGNSNHMRSHVVTFTNHKLACNACGLWFTSIEEAVTHHRRHRNKSKPYRCPRCSTQFKKETTFNEHYNKNQCTPSQEVPDIKCEVCWRYYPTNNLYKEHKCGGEDSRQGGKCNKCNRNYALLKNLKKHESICTAKKKGELNVDPELLRSLKSFQVRVARCDPLLSNVKHGHVDVSGVHREYGIDRNCVYPYISGSFRIKSEFSINQYDGMVNIDESIKDELCSASFVHWDSEDESDSDTEKSITSKPVDSLSILSLKTIFSQKLLGKVPRRHRRVKTEKFDMNTDLYVDISKNIDSIIDNLGKDDDLVSSNDLSKVKSDLSIDFDNLLSDDKDKGDGKETDVDDTSRNDAVSFDDLLKNDDQISKNKEKEDDEMVKGEKETEIDDASKNDVSTVNLDDLLKKSDDQDCKTIENEDDAMLKNDEKEMEVNDASKNEDSTVRFDDLLKKSDDQVGKTIENDDDETLKGDEKETEVKDASKDDASAVNFDDLIKNNDDQVSKANEKQNDDEKVSDDVEMAVIDTDKVNDDIIETDYTPNNVELSNHDVVKSEGSTEVNNGEKNSHNVINNDISNEQSNVRSNNDKDLPEDTSKDTKQNETDTFESEKSETRDISENNTKLENTDNEVPINDATLHTEVKEDLNAPSNNITKETLNYDNKESTDAINELSTNIQTEDSNNCTSVVNGETDPKSDELNSLDDVSDTEMDDNKLMEALDAQIGEINYNSDQSPAKKYEDLNNDCNESENDEIANKECKNSDETVLNHIEKSDSTEHTEETVISEKDIDIKNTNDKKVRSLIDDTEAQVNDRTVNDTDHNKFAENDTVVNQREDVKCNDKITLDDLISTSQNPDLKSLDLDSISDDEFNFDA